MPLNDNHLREIGRIAVAFNILEQTAQSTVQVLMGGDSIPVTVRQEFTIGESFDRLISKMRTLAQLRLPYPDLLVDLEKWLREAKEVKEDRNRVLHTGWITFFDEPQDADVATALRRTTRNTYGELREYTPYDLNAIARRILDVDKKLIVLTRRMRTLPMKDSYPK
jgi:hypothetical protein